jgi:hypothetical protein
MGARWENVDDDDGRDAGVRCAPRGHDLQRQRDRSCEGLWFEDGRLYDANTLDEIWPRQKPLERQWWWTTDSKR